MITRAMTSSDRRYIAPTWVRSSRYPNLPRRERIEMVDRILDDPRASVLARVTDDTVHAWICVLGDRLHYVYVAAPLRMHGVARKLIVDAFGLYPDCIDATHPWPHASARFRYSPALREAA